MRILHISDLHFGIKEGKERSRKEVAGRDYYIDDLIRGLGSITAKQPLDYIFITGDIAYSASEEAYREAGMWLTKISRVCRVPADRIYLCPGNRDIDKQKMKDAVCPENQQEAKELLNIENFDQLSKKFRMYRKFCHDAGLPTYELGGKQNYLTGVAVNSCVNVVCLNTAWFAEADTGKNNVWIGSDLVKQIKREKKYANGQPTIAIMHHPVASWNEEERSSVNNSDNVYHEVCRIADMILTGHTHAAEDGYGYWNDVYICGNGAVYKGQMYHHNFHMYEWDSGKAGPIDCIRTVYEFNGSTWHRKSEKIRIEAKNRQENKSEKPFRYSFSILWWTR